MTHEIKLILKETSEGLGTWVSEEVNELVFITEVIGEIERGLEKEGLSIVKTVHPTPGDRFKPFYAIDLGWFSVLLYRKDELENHVISINIQIKNITSYNPEGTASPHTCLIIDLFVKFGEKIRIVDFKTQHIGSEATYRDVLGDDKIAEINKVVNVINDMNKTIPDFDKIDINM